MLNRLLLPTFIILAAVCSFSLKAQSEPVVNLPDTPVEEESKEAAQNLIESVVFFYMAVMELEKRNIDTANETIDKAEDSAVRAHSIYAGIQKQIEGQVVENFRALSALSESEAERVSQTLQIFQITPPQDFQSLVQLVTDELSDHRSHLENIEFSGELSDNIQIKNMQDSIHRTVSIGLIVPYFTKER